MSDIATIALSSTFGRREKEFAHSMVQGPDGVDDFSVAFLQAELMDDLEKPSREEFVFARRWRKAKDLKPVVVAEPPGAHCNKLHIMWAVLHSITEVRGLLLPLRGGVSF